jgi:hypothetical protein
MPDLDLNIGDAIMVSRYYDEQPFAGVAPWAISMMRMYNSGHMIQPNDEVFESMWQREVQEYSVWRGDKRFMPGTKLFPIGQPNDVRRGLTMGAVLGHSHPIMDMVEQFVPSGVTFVRVTGSCVITAVEE